MRKNQGWCLLVSLGVTLSGACTGSNMTWFGKRPPKPREAAPPMATEVVATTTETPTHDEPSASPTTANPEALTGEPETDIQAFVQRLRKADREPRAAAAAAPHQSPGPVATNTGVALSPDTGAGPTGKRQAPSARLTEPPRLQRIRIDNGSGTAEHHGADSPKTLSTNEPLDATVVRGGADLQRHEAQLEQELEKTPDDLGRQWALSMVRLVLGKEKQALKLSGALAEGPAKLLRGAVRVSADVRHLLTEPSYPPEDALAAVDALRERLKERAELSIPVVALCTRVRTFGVYDEMPLAQFVPHQANRTVVYAEIRNFASRRRPDGQYETMLSGRLELLTKDGRSVWQHKEDSIKDVSKQRREDFFLAKLVAFPADLAPGDYVLKVMIQDTLAGKTNEARLAFPIGRQQLADKGP